MWGEERGRRLGVRLFRSTRIVGFARNSTIKSLGVDLGGGLLWYLQNWRLLYEAESHFWDEKRE